MNFNKQRFRIISDKNARSQKIKIELLKLLNKNNFNDPKVCLVI